MSTVDESPAQTPQVTSATARTRSFTMTDEHKESLALGREQSRIVREYLMALETHQPKRGRRRTPESIRHRLLAIHQNLENEQDPLVRLRLLAEREQLSEELNHLENASSLDGVEEAFVEIAAQFSDRKGISYAAWRAAGVDAAVLRRAGLTRAS